MKTLINKLSVPRLLLCLLAALIISGCTSTPKPQPVSKLTPPDVMSPISENADYYLSQAQKSEGSANINWQLLAARAFLAGGQSQPALAVLQQLDKLTLSPQQQAELRIIRAQSYSMEGNNQAALSQLELPPQWSLSDEHWKRYFALKSSVLAAMDNGIAAAQARVALGSYLKDEAEIKANNNQIWALLTPLSPFTLRSFQSLDAADESTGWLELAALTNEYAGKPNELTAQIQQWQALFPLHPAALQMPDALQFALEAKPYQPQKIAVLLPLTGKYQRQGIALQDGILSSYLAKPDNATELTFYDTNQQDMATLYQQVKSEGVEFIVGPLLRSKVNALAALIQDTPWLSLNQLDQYAAPEQSYFFSLSPEGEAAQTATRISDDGLTYPMVIAPNTKFGQRMVTSFSEDWTKITGAEPEVVYFNNRQEIQGIVKSLLQTDKSQQRINQIKQLVGYNIISEVRSRRDIDAMYLVAKPIELRMLKPFIDVTVSPFADPIKLYAGSRSFSSDLSTTQMQELNGIKYSDLPMIIDPDNAVAIAARKTWPERNQSDQRFYAMGYDTTLLIGELVQLQVSPGYSVQGISGTLFLNSDGEIERRLAWAEYQDGQIVLLDKPAQEQTVATDDEVTTADENSEHRALEPALPVQLPAEADTDAAIETNTNISAETGANAAMETNTNISAETAANAAMETNTNISAETAANAAMETNTNISAETAATAAMETNTNISAETAANAAMETNTNISAEIGATAAMETNTNISAETGATAAMETNTNISAETAANAAMETNTNISAEIGATAAMETSTNISAETGANAAIETGTNISAETRANALQ